MEHKETEKLKDIEFKVYIQYGMILVFFQAPLITPLLRQFLEKNDFYIYIDKNSGITSGVWVSGMFTAEEYALLRETFKEYGVELPVTSKLSVKS